MNKDNILRMVEYLTELDTIAAPFHMDVYRENNTEYHNPHLACKSPACVVGHCTVLDTPENRDRCFNGMDGAFNYGKWTYEFTGLTPFTRVWAWAFAWQWAEVDNTIQGAIARLNYLLIHGEPPFHFDEVFFYNDEQSQQEMLAGWLDF